MAQNQGAQPGLEAQGKGEGLGQSAARGKQFDNLRNILKNAKSSSGKDLYTHLQEVFNKLILHYPEQALEKFEEVSYLLKNNGLGVDIDKYLILEDIHSYKDFTDALANYRKAMEQFYPKKPLVEEEEQEPVELGPIGFVPNLLQDAQLLEWAGIGFGEQETYRILLSLKKLVQDSGATNVRFFGKIYGTEKDYYVAEGVLEGEDEPADGQEGEAEEKPADFEARGSGVNKLTYWVTDYLLGKWTKLPDLFPSNILATRQIKVTFSGNLDRQIFTNPFFFGTEKIYLRAQIARIAHSTSLCPKGLYKLEEDNDKEIVENAPEDGGELKMPSTLDMSQPENWVHYTQNILEVGRLTHMDPEAPEDPPEDYDADKEKEKIEKADPYQPRLKAITQDAPVEVGLGWDGNIQANNKQVPWVVKLMGDKSQYLDPMNGKKLVCYGTVVVRSLQWPGSYTFYNNERYTSIYVGSGQKYETKSYYPLYPPLIMNDPLEYGEQPEPTPLFEEPEQQQDEGEGEGNPNENEEELENE